MLLTPHILTGVAIITLIQNPILGLFFVLSSHYFLDLFPQTEYTIKNIRAGFWKKSLPDFAKVFLDVSIGMTIVFFLKGYSLIIFAAAGAAVFPDILTLLHCIFPLNKPLKKHMKIHGKINAVCKNEEIPEYWGIVSQIAVIIIAICFLLQQ